MLASEALKKLLTKSLTFNKHHAIVSLFKANFLRCSILNFRKSAPLSFGSGMFQIHWKYNQANDTASK